MKQGFRKGDKRKETGYNMTSSASSVTSISSLFDDNKLYQLEVKEQAVLFTATHYYFGDKFNHFVLATEKNLIDLFPKCADQLAGSCKKNSVDFNRRDHLEILLSFLQDRCLRK